MENAVALFEKEGKNKTTEEAARKKDELFKQIGQLQVGNEYLKRIQTTIRDRTEMVEKDHPELSVAQKCVILGISRSSYYYQPKEASEDPDLLILEGFLEVLNEKPFYGYRRITRELHNLDVTRKQVRRIMNKAGLQAIYSGSQLSKLAKSSKKYPYLLKGMDI
jgi:putative transposase